MATGEFSKFADILSAALSQHHLSGFEIYFDIRIATCIFLMKIDSTLVLILTFQLYEMLALGSFAKNL